MILQGVNVPYINPDDREQYQEGINKVVEALLNHEFCQTMVCFPGHLNYIITTLITRAYQKALERNECAMHYTDYNEIVGMLECCKLEFYRRKIADYEDDACYRNGDVE